MARSISPRQWQRVNDQVGYVYVRSGIITNVLFYSKHPVWLQLLLQEAIRGRHYNISIDHYNRLFQVGVNL